MIHISLLADLLPVDLLPVILTFFEAGYSSVCGNHAFPGTLRKTKARALPRTHPAELSPSKTLKAL